jgi:hypothetical protein
LYWSVIPRACCACKPFSVPTSRPRQRRSCHGSSDAGRWRSPLKRRGPILGWRPNANGRSRLLPGQAPILLALCSLVTVLALRLRQGGQLPVPVTAWYRKAEPPFADCLVLVRRHLWRARYLENAAAETEFVQFPREAFDLSINGFPLAA